MWVDKNICYTTISSDDCPSMGRNEVNQGGLVFYVLFNVHSQGCSKHRIDKELLVDIRIIEGLVWRKLYFIVRTVTAARGRTSWCHGSCQRHDYLWQGGRSPTCYFSIGASIPTFSTSPDAKKIVMFPISITLYDPV